MISMHSTAAFTPHTQQAQRPAQRAIASRLSSHEAREAGSATACTAVASFDRRAGTALDGKAPSRHRRCRTVVLEVVDVTVVEPR